MKFVTGGCYQGKQQWVLTHEKLLQSQIADGAVCSAKEIKDAKALDHFHLLVQRWMLADKRGALAPLELAAERVGVPEDVPYTPKLLAATFMGSFDKDPADRFPALLDGRDNTLVTERAIAAAVPEEFVTALVSKTLGELPIL